MGGGGHCSPVSVESHPFCTGSQGREVSGGSKPVFGVCMFSPGVKKMTEFCNRVVDWNVSACVGAFTHTHTHTHTRIEQRLGCECLQLISSDSVYSTPFLRRDIIDVSVR